MARKAPMRQAQPADAHVGARIRLRRNMLGMSQMEMANQIGVTFQQVQKYEKGANRIGVSRLLQICAVLDIAPGWLFEDVPGAKPRSTAETRTIEGDITDFHADNLAPRLIGLWKRLPPEVKRAMLALMIAMAQRTSEPQ